MVRGKAFYAVWDEGKGLWSTDEYDVARLVDQDIDKVRKDLGPVAEVRTMMNFNSNSWKQFRSFLSHLSDNSKQLDQKVTFSDTVVTKEDYVSKRVSYPLVQGEMPAYEEIMSTLYDPEERDKLEWAIGAVLSGDSRTIQKFMVLYGASGAGKSTFLNIVQDLFEGYWTVVDADALVSTANAFSTAAFKEDPLVAIHHDADLSRVSKNTLLNSIVSHEDILINEKNKPAYKARVNSMLFLGTNKPVRITDAKSGLLRRMIYVKPSGRLIETQRYHVLVSQVKFELGAIAYHCLKKYREMGKEYYAGYRATQMALETDTFYNFMEHNYDIFNHQEFVTLKQAWEMYKTFCEESALEYKLPLHKFRTEFGEYFSEFHDRYNHDNERIRSVYTGFLKEKFAPVKYAPKPYSLVLDQKSSLIDSVLSGQPAQYAVWSNNSHNEIPGKPWRDVETILSDLDTTRVHYVKPPLNHIVIDFDLKDDDGNKSSEKNLRAASEWPATYGEFSQGGSGVHLHYLFDGDPETLSRIYSPGVEVKVFVGDSSLRRRLTLCNNIPVATIRSGLPLKEEKVINFEGIKSERSLIALIERNLRKEIHPGTKPSVDFIHKILEDAYSSGLVYDVTNLRSRILAFAMNSTNQSSYCIKLVARMKFKSEQEPIPADEPEQDVEDDSTLVIFDCEVYPNLFVVSWKYKGTDSVTSMVNPTPAEIEKLLAMRLVGFYNRKYDNHILYARMLGFSNEKLFKLSQRLIDGDRGAFFASAYDVSYADVYDFASVKKSLKRWQLELGIRHLEMGHPWDQPVPAEMVAKVVEYCENDVRATEAVFNDRAQDLVARRILAKISGLNVNQTTQKHTAKIIFGNDKNASDKFVYTDLSKEFPGYIHEFGKSTYRDEVTGEGGYVYAEPGMHTDVAVLDVESMHPSSIVNLNLFGPYTKNFEDLLNARLAIKHKKYDQARKMLGGIFSEYLTSEDDAKELSYALKIVINIVYGLTSASFPNPFRDIRNKDNIVAKRGALFMIDLKNAVQDKGFQVVHIKTDSIKIPKATPEIIKFVHEFGAKYGYKFEHETTYDKMCLVNDAVYIAKEDGKWSATGAQFAHPYVFKTLFSKEPTDFDDLLEIKTVTTALYLDLDADKPMALTTEPTNPPRFIGKAGAFVPVKPGCGGGLLLREKGGKYYAATGSKGFFWLEGEVVRQNGNEQDVDMQYYSNLVDAAIDQIRKYGDPDWFLSQ